MHSGQPVRHNNPILYPQTPTLPYTYAQPVSPFLPTHHLITYIQTMYLQQYRLCIVGNLFLTSKHSVLHWFLSLPFQYMRDSHYNISAQYKSTGQHLIENKTKIKQKPQHNPPENKIKEAISQTWAPMEPHSGQRKYMKKVGHIFLKYK